MEIKENKPPEQKHTLNIWYEGNQWCVQDVLWSGIIGKASAYDAAVLDLLTKLKERR